jgi:hypothetical protein
MSREGPPLFIYISPFLSYYLLIHFTFKIDIIDSKLIINKLSYIIRNISMSEMYIKKEGSLNPPFKMVQFKSCPCQEKTKRHRQVT